MLTLLTKIEIQINEIRRFFDNKYVELNSIMIVGKIPLRIVVIILIKRVTHKRTV